MRTEERGVCGVIGSGVVCVKYNVNTGITNETKKNIWERVGYLVEGRRKSEMRK